MQAEENEAMKTHLMGNYKNKKQQFDSIFDSSMHEVSRKRTWALYIMMLPNKSRNE